MLVVVIALATKKANIARVYECLGLNDCLGLAALIILHVFRFQYSGKWCSLDSSVASDGSPSGKDEIDQWH